MKLTKQSLTMYSIVFSITAFFTALGYLFTDTSNLVSVIYPITGLSIAVYSMYKQKIVPFLFLGTFLASLIARYYLYDETIIQIFLISLLLSTIVLIQILFFRYAMDKTKTYGSIHFKTIVTYTLIVLTTSLIGASLSSLVLSTWYGFDLFVGFIGKWYIADITGTMIFGTTILSSFYFDEIWFKRKNILLAVIEGIVFMLLSYLIFSSTLGQTDIHQYYFVFLILFFIAAYLFCYHMIAIFAVLYILSYKLFWLDSIQNQNMNFTQIVLDLNVYLFTIVFISLIVRMVLYSLEEKNMILSETNEKLENLISSTNQMISFQQLKTTETESNIDYVKRIFRIAISLYDSFELASCYIKVDDKPVFVDTYGYDLDLVNSLDFSHHFHWALRKPEHIVSPENDLKERLGPHYKTYNKAIPELKESIRFGIYIDEINCGGMSFDISTSSPKSFAKADFDNFQSFQKLMNSLYEINFLNTKNITLKNDIVLSLVKTLELYDNYTGGHSQEVAILSKKVAEKMNLSKQTIYDVYWAGIVHDIGKIGVSPDILNKTEKLTDEEYDAVKLHPIYGSNILYQSQDLHSIAEIVKHHHEHWDGNGYPSHLKGDKIPLGAQILCISDSVSAMHGKRRYADTKSIDQIITELQKCSGTHFNPTIARTMIELIREGALYSLQEEII